MALYAVLGWINTALVCLMLAPYLMRLFNLHVLKKKDGAYVKINKLLRKAHRYIGGALILSISAHGWLALGVLRLHTGTLLGAMAVIMAVFAIIFIIAKKKWAFKAHKALAIAFLTLMVLHLAVPSALYYIFGV